MVFNIVYLIFVLLLIVLETLGLAFTFKVKLTKEYNEWNQQQKYRKVDVVLNVICLIICLVFITITFYCLSKGEKINIIYAVIWLVAVSLGILFDSIHNYRYLKYKKKIKIISDKSSQ